MRVMIVVTHLLGTGHLTRALTLANAFRDAGHEALVVSGGVPPEHLGAGIQALLQLPPVRSDGVDFTRLLAADGGLASDAYLVDRQSILLDALDRYAPDALITELFPFGRRILRTEFIALLEAARARLAPPKILASIRDILAPPSKPAKAAFADEAVTEYYDGVLVHSDPDLTPLDLSWPVSDQLRPALQYTGFVAPLPAGPSSDRAGEGEVLVTAGGGDVGGALFDVAIRAAALRVDLRWRLLVGGQNAKERSAAFNEGAPSNLLAEPARRDFRQMLHLARVSVSMCGYNTALDVMQASCPAVFVPYDAGNEVEQGIRAEALSRQTGVEAIPTTILTPDVLLSAIASVEGSKRPPLAQAQTSGAQRTVEMVSKMVGGGHAR